MKLRSVENSGGRTKNISNNREDEEKRQDTKEEKLVST